LPRLWLSCSTLPNNLRSRCIMSASRAHTLSSGAPPDRSCHCRRGATRRDGATLPRDHPGDSPPALVRAARRRPPPSWDTRISRWASRTKRTTAGAPTDCSSVGNAHRDPPWLLNRSYEHVQARRTTRNQKPVPSEFWARSDSEESPYLLPTLSLQLQPGNFDLSRV